MAKHEFGIMGNAPERGKRYDEYEPQKYDCISVNDIYIEALDACMIDLDFYWHTLDIASKGLAYCGVTLIPPETAAKMAVIIEESKPLAALCALLQRAVTESKWVIHFGL